MDFIASRARVGASARQNSEIKCVHCSDAFEPRHTFNAPTTNRSLGNTQCELNERREHPAKSACIRVVADSPSRPWAHCSSPHHLCTRSAHRRLPRKVPLRKFQPRRTLSAPAPAPSTPAQPSPTAAAPVPQSPSPQIQAPAAPSEAAPPARSAEPSVAPAPASGGRSIGGDLLPRQLSYTRMFLDADWVVKAVMIGLAFASLVTWTVWLAKTWEIARARLQVRRDVRCCSQRRRSPTRTSNCATATQPRDN